MSEVHGGTEITCAMVATVKVGDSCNLQYNTCDHCDAIRSRII